jgi:hypothetical protein
MHSLVSYLALWSVLLLAVLGTTNVLPYILNFDEVRAQQEARMVELEDRKYSCEKSGGEWKVISKGDHICLKNKNYYVE